MNTTELCVNYYNDRCPDSHQRLAFTVLFRLTISAHYDNAFLHEVAIEAHPRGSHYEAKKKIREIINIARPLFRASQNYRLGHRIDLEIVDISHVDDTLTLHSDIEPL